MKKIWRKISKKKDQDSSSRITNDTVAEHRERIISGGRRFKYPMQYAKHKLVINTIIISIIVLLGAVFFMWWQIYKEQNSASFFYRITQAIPLPVATVDGKTVLYRDYLVKYRGASHYRQQKENIDQNSEDGRRQSNYDKDQAMDDAIADAYAAKLADELGITISKDDVESSIERQRQHRDGIISKEAYDSLVLDFYGWTTDEYRREVYKKLLKQEVSFYIDEGATKTAQDLTNSLVSNSDIEALAAKYKSRDVQYRNVGWIDRGNQDNGLSDHASNLKKTQVSSVFKAYDGTGYYAVRLVDSNDIQIKYDYIFIPLSTFRDQLKQIKAEEGKVNIYITMPEEVN